MSVKTLKKYVPRMERSAFVELPDGVELAGSPAEYRFRLFVLNELGHFACEEAVGRIFTGLEGRGRWAAVRVAGFVDSLKVELQMRKEEPPRYDFPHSKLIFGGSGMDGVCNGLQECIDRGWLGIGRDADGSQIVWPTPELLEIMQVYRTNMRPSQ